MIIELSNGLDHLFQWDTGQKVTVPENVPTVHFKWGNDAVSFDVVDGWVEIPPELTQKAGYILLWTYREDHTLDAARIPVERRPKPDGYAYTPTEIKTWESLDGRITALEAANAQSDWDQNDPEGKGFIRNRPFYAEEPPIITNLGNTYDVWDKICTQNGVFLNRDDVEKAALSFIIEGTLYKNIVPRFFFSAYVYNYVAGEYEVTVYENNSQIKCFAAGKEVTNWQIVSVSDKEKVHYLDSKYLDPGLLARIKALEDGGGVAGVSSVNGQTGAVTITASWIGAATPSDVNTAVNSAWSEAQQTLGPLFDAKQPKGDYITQDGLQDATNAALAQAKASGEFDGAGLDVTGATAGQTVKISAVDVNGVPTAWVPVDMGSGEKLEKIAEIVIPDGAAETNALTINKDINGDQFRLIKARLCVKQPKYTGDSSIPSFSFAMINGKTSGRICPLAYTSAFRMPSKSVITGSVYEVDVSGAQQIETVYRSGNVGWSDDSSSDFVTYSNPRDEYARYVADTLWAKPITSIGGAGMLIYPGCRYVLYGVRE